jgi:hypothetical protein
MPGASWIFARADLDRALLATRMNGAPLPPNHGAPVRLIVPGGTAARASNGSTASSWSETMRRRRCRCGSSRRELTKWECPRWHVTTSAPSSTPPPCRCASRNGQKAPGVLSRGRHHLGRGDADRRAVNPLQVGDAWVRVEHCPLPESTLTWSLWTHTWKPASPGRYQIVLKVDDPTIRTRRLDIFFYVREVEIDET